MVERCIDTSATPASFAIVPAGTANLFARTSESPGHRESGRHRVDGPAAHSTSAHERRAFRGDGRRRLRRAMIREADGGLKDRFGRRIRVDGDEAARPKPFEAKIKVDGATWFDGQASSILVGNVGKLLARGRGVRGRVPGGRDARTRGRHGRGLTERTRAIVRTAVGSANRRSSCRQTKASSVKVKLDRKILYLDGGDRELVNPLEIRSSRRRSRSVSPPKPRTREDRGPGFVDLGADWRRRPGTLREDRTEEPRPRMRSCDYEPPTGSATHVACVRDVVPARARLTAGRRLTAAFGDSAEQGDRSDQTDGLPGPVGNLRDRCGLPGARGWGP